MRTGANPLRESVLPGYPPFVAAAIVHLPNLDGYHAKRLEVVKLCLESMRANAGLDCGIAVWDNGSCPDFRAWLEHEYKPDTLILSQNIGKDPARASLMRMFPPETVLGISDDDMLFYPDWFAKQAVLLHEYPNVGAVSGYPVRTMFRWATASTLAWAHENGLRIETGKLIPAEWDMDFCTSIGRDYSYQLEYTRDDRDTLIYYRGIPAYATAHHCQFICYAGRVAPLTTWDGRAISDEKIFDRAIDNAGMLRLCTTERLVRHIGNVIDPSIQADAEKMNLWQSTTTAQPTN